MEINCVKQFFVRNFAFVLSTLFIAVSIAIVFEPIAFFHELFHSYPVFFSYALDNVLFGFFVAAVCVFISWMWQSRRARATQALYNQKSREFQELLESLPIAIAKLDANQQIEISNPALSQFRQQIGAAALQDTVWQLMANREVASNTPITEYKRTYPLLESNRELCIEWLLHSHTGPDRVGSYLLMGRDVSQHESVRQQLSIAQRILNNTPIGVMVVGINSGIEYVNQSFELITGYSADEIEGSDPSILNSGRHDEAFFQAMYQTLLKDGRWQGEIWNRRKNGDIFLEWLSITSLADSNDNITHYIGMFSEITAQEHVRDKLHTLAYYDALTSLANRTLFNDQLERMIENRSDKKLCVVFIDLDGFKRINDSMGHAVGDQLLANFAMRLKNNIRNADIVARWGGDEFILAIEVSDSLGGIARFCSKQLDILKTPFMLAGRELNVTASMGVSIYGEDAQNTSELIRNADIAMYQAKRRGKNRYEIFSSQLHHEITESIEIENRLRLAIRFRQVEVYFQPQVQMQGPDIVGLETLARWTDNELGFVSPQKFIAVAEDTGLIGELGALIISKALAQFKYWHEQHSSLALSINLSASQLQDDNLAAFLLEEINSLDIDPQQIKLEITEDVFMSDIDKSIHTTSQLKDIGFQISLDDFGTGYSSLSYLKDFDIDELKIDRSFVDSIQDSERNRAIVAAIIVMAQVLDIDCIVEGVETERQLGELESLGCTLFQGYLFHKPMPAGEVGPLLEEELLEVETES